jgi:hypothetical protein
MYVFLVTIEEDWVLKGATQCDEDTGGGVEVVFRSLLVADKPGPQNKGALVGNTFSVDQPTIRR